MKITRSLACANTLILSGALVAATIVGMPRSFANGHSAWESYLGALFLAGAAVTLAGTIWSGWLARRDARPHGIWSKNLFVLGFVLCPLELLVILWGPLRIGAA